MAAATDGPMRAVENGRCVGIVDRVSILQAMAGGHEDPVAVASGRIAAPPAAFARRARAGAAGRRRWGRSSRLMLVGVLPAARASSPGPRRSPGRSCPCKLDDLQDWLLEQRTADEPEPHLRDPRRLPRASPSGWSRPSTTRCCGSPGSARSPPATLIVLRFGGWRAALIVFAAFVSFALMGLWEESIQTLALMSAAVLLSLGDRRCRIGVFAGPQRALLPRDHAGARRDADRARLRLPDADRDPLLGRPGGGGDLHDDLRDPARRAHHRARHPRRHARTRSRPRSAFGATQRADALQGAAAAGPPPAAAVGQPDDHVRALAGGDRRPDRRPRARRRGHQRALLERRAGASSPASRS